MASNVVGSGTRGAGRKTAGHPWFHKMTRVGLVARGVLYLLIGWLAIQVGMGEGGGKEADKSGALQEVASKPGGTIALWVIVAGLAALALWRFAEARYGRPIPDGDKARKRAVSFGWGVAYTLSCIGAASYALSHKSSSSDQQSKSYTAKAMAEPGGRWLVLLVGLVVLGYGVWLITRAFRRKFRKELKTHQMSEGLQKGVETLGVVGHTARGIVIVGVGVFFTYAAITFDPGKAKGLDGTLREIATTPAGPMLLVAVALGLAIYGIYSFCEARWRKIEVVRS